MERITGANPQKVSDLMSETISVIVPVYNVEKYICQCIDSILSQDYQDLEIILIDDGSTDTSGKICDEYARRDSRIHVIHQKNGGAAAAKNAGLKIASGKYLAFADSDDYLETDVYSYMKQLMKENNAQAVQCAFRDVFRDHTRDRIFKPGKTVWAVGDYMALFVKDWTCSLLWDKLFERTLFEGIRFKEGNKIDDEFFTYKGMMNAQKIVTDDRIIYNYRKRKSGVMLSPLSAERIVKDRIACLSERRKIVNERFPDLREKYDLHFIESMIILAGDPGIREDSLDLIKKELQSYRAEKGHTKLPLNLKFATASILHKKWKEIPSGSVENTDWDVYFD